MTTGKIPVFRSLGAGLYFAFFRFISVLRGGLLPGLVLVAATGAFFWYSAPWAIDPEAPPPIPDPAFVGVFYLVSIVTGLMLAAGLTTAYFREPMGPFYLRFWSAEFRLLLAMIIIYIIVLIGVAVPAVALFAVIGVATGTDIMGQLPDIRYGSEQGLQLADAGFVLIGVAGIAIGVWALFLILRFGLVLPVIVSEKRIGVGRSWSLMRGNTLRLFGLFVLLTIVTYVLLILGIVAAGQSPLGGFLDEVFRRVQDGTFEPNMLLSPLGAALLLLPVIAYLIFYAMMIGAVARAYEALAEAELIGEIPSPAKRKPAVKPDTEGPPANDD